MGEVLQCSSMFPNFYRSKSSPSFIFSPREKILSIFLNSELLSGQNEIMYLKKKKKKHCRKMVSAKMLQGITVLEAFSVFRKLLPW